MISFRITSFGFEQHEQKIRLGKLRMADVRPALVKISRDMMKVEEAMFRSQGRRGGGSWARDKKETMKRKHDPRILIESGRLMRSVTRPRARYQVLRFGRTKMEFYTTRPGAAAHQFGDPDRGIPARPFMKFTSTDRDRWGRILANHVLEAFASRRV